MGPRACLDRCGKSRPTPPEFDPRTVQPVASRYNDYATRPAPWSKLLQNPVSFDVAVCVVRIFTITFERVVTLEGGGTI